MKPSVTKNKSSNKSALNLKASKVLKDYSDFARSVLSWYKTYGRHDLPWRRSITPYKILVSEIMLQQTQVSRVHDKYKMWMTKYPTLRALSLATLEEVLILWQGLGYQRRAKALLTIAKEHRCIPKTYEGLLTLPGIGEYTASAIMAFAYDSFSPMLETNIRTALIETFHTKKKVVSDEALKIDLAHLTSCKEVQSVGARIGYYALMDYGAYLKKEGISHNARTKGYRKQTAYIGSQRKVRAEVLFAITHNVALPQDARVPEVLEVLAKERFIIGSTKSGWHIA